MISLQNQQAKETALATASASHNGFLEQPELIIPALNIADFACFEGIKSEYATLYKQRQEAKHRHAIIISGRFTAHARCLIPQINKFHTDHPDQWIDVFLSINHVYDKTLPPPCVAGLSTSPFILDPTSKYLETNVRRGPVTNVSHILSMFTHNARAFSMIQDVVNATKNIQGPYTWVLKFRPDVINPTLPTMMSQPPHHPGIYIPHGYDYGGLNDRVAMGDMASMGAYCDLINHVDKHYDTNPDYMIHPETMVLVHLAELKLPIFRFPYETGNLDMGRGL